MDLKPDPSLNPRPCTDGRLALTLGPHIRQTTVTPVLEAWRYFESAAPSYRSVALRWMVSAKQDATRQRRLAEPFEACADKRRLLKSDSERPNIESARFSMHGMDLSQ